MAAESATRNTQEVRVPGDSVESGWNGAEGRHWVHHRDRYARMHQPLTERLLAAADISPGEAVVDIGCGCGGTTCAAARAAAPGPVLGVDISEPMLTEARHVAERDALSNVRFVAGDAQTYPFGPAGFDVAISRFGVMFFADPLAAFATIAHALRPGGRLAFLCWQPLPRNEFLRVPLSVVAAHVPLPDLGGDGPGGFSLADPDRVRALLTGAGFDTVGIDAVVEPLWLGHDTDDVVGYLRGTPLAQSLLAQADPDTASTIDAELRATLEPYDTGDGVRLGSAAWLVTATRPPRPGKGA